MTRDPIAFIERVLINPDDGKPFKLLPSQREFFKYAFMTGPDGRLLYPEQIYSTGKKGGKTTTNGLHVLTTLLLFGSRFGEAIVCANDEEQAVARTFTTIRRIVESTPSLKRAAKITETKITFPSTGATISAISSDYAGAAGSNQCISSFDELWAFVHEKSRRLFDELVPVPNKPVSIRLVTTYAGWEAESELLWSLYQRGMAQPLVGPNLHAGNGILMAWHHEPVASWQSPEWIELMRRSLRPAQFARMIQNTWTSSTEDSLFDLQEWDRCIDQNLTRSLADRSISAWAGVDASTKRDSTGLALVTFDKQRQKVRLLDHKIFQPSPEFPLDFERTIENTLLEWHARFRLRGVYFDPFQMQATAQSLMRENVKMIEYPQTSDRLTAAGECLYGLIKAKNLLVYPDAAMRLAISRATAVESARGWRIAKAKQSHKIDIVVALAMACLAAIKAPRGGMTLATLPPPYATGRSLPPQMIWTSDTGWRRADEQSRTRIKWTTLNERGEVIKETTS